MAGANDYRLLLQANLDATKIQKQITDIQKNYSFKLAVKLDFGDIEKQIQAFKSQWGEIQKKLAQVTNPTGAGGAGGAGKSTGVASGVLSINAINNDVNKYEALMERVKKINAEVGREAASFKVRTMFDENGEKIIQAQISYNDKLGKSVSETYRLLQVEKEVNGVMEKKPEWVQVSNSYNDSLEKRSRILQSNIDYADKFLAKSNELQQTPDVINAKRAAQNLKDLSEGALAGGPVDVKSINAARKELERLDAVVRQNGVSAYSWTKEIGIAIKRTIEWSLSIGLVYGAFNQLREGIQYIVELNKELISIQVVTNRTNEEMDKMALGFNKLAKELGATTIEVAKGSTEWFRQGKTVEETQELMRSTMMMSKLGAIDSAEATQYLTAILNGFKMEASESVDVVDKLVAVDNVAATSVAEMATALQRTANMAQESGVSFDALIGYIATVSSTTRKSASTIGESFKTMFARLEAIKLGQLDELGQSISDVERVLGTMGIKVRDNANTFRNMEEVLDELAAKWDTLTDIQRRAAAQAIGGVRQYENLLALMENYNKAKDLEEVSVKSAGLAQERYAIYLDGVEAAQNRVTATWEQLWMTTLSSDAVKGWYNIAAGILEITNNAGGLIPVMVTVLGLFVAFSGQQIIAGFSAIGKSITALIAGLRGVSVAATAAQASLGILGLAISALSIGYMIYQAWNKSTEEIIQETNQAINDTTSAISRLEGNKESLEALGKRFDVLKIKVNKNNAEEKEFIDVQNKIKDLLPEVAGKFNEYGDFVLDASVSMETLNAETEKQIENQKTLFESAVIEGTKAKTKDYVNQAKELKKLADHYNFMLKANEDWAEANSYENIAAGGAATEKFTEEQIILQEFAVKKQKILLEQLTDTFKDEYDRIGEEGKKYIISQLMLQGEEGKILADRLMQVEQMAFDINKTYIQLGETLGPPIPPYEKYSDFFERIKSDVDSLSTILEKSQAKEMDLSSYESLLEMGSQYADLVRLENDEIIVNEDALRRMQLEKLNAIYASEKFKEATDAEKEALAANIAILENSIPLSTQYVDTFTQIISGVAQGNEKFLELGQRLAETNRSFENGILTAGQYFEQLKTQLDEVDLSKMFAEDQAGAESFFTGLALNSTAAFAQINSMFNAGQISITDYTYQLANLSDVFGMIGGMLGDLTGNQDAATESVNSMAAATEELRLMQETNILVQDAYIQTMAGTLQFGTDAYNESMRLIADAAYASGQAWYDTEGNALTSANGIYNHLTATNGNFETFANQTANKTGTTIGKIASAIGDLLVGVGDSIKNFKGNIKFTPKVSGGIDWKALLPGGNISNLFKNLQIDLGISGEGGFDFASIGKKISDFGKSIPGMVDELEFDARIYEEPAGTSVKRPEAGGYSGSSRKPGSSGAAKVAKEEVTSVEDLLKIVVAKIKQTKEAEKDALEESLKAYKKTYEEKKKITKDLYDKEIERLKTALQNYKDIIETRKELLKTLKDESDYNKEMADKEQSLSKTQAEILKLRLDDSEEAKGRILALQEEEQKQIEDIKKTQDDKNYQDQINALDNDYEAYEKMMNAKMKLEEEIYNRIIEGLEKDYANFESIIQSGVKGIEEYLDKSGQVMVDAMEIVDGKAEGLYEDLIDWNNEYGDGVEANVTKAWNDAYKALEKYRNEVGQLDSQYVLSILAKATIPEYHTGGVVEGKAGQERFAKLMAGEVVVTQSQMEKFMKYTLPGIAKTKPIIGSSGNVKFDNLLSLNVQGNMDNSVIPNVEKIVNAAVEKLNKFMLTRGHIRNASQFGN